MQGEYLGVSPGNTGGCIGHWEQEGKEAVKDAVGAGSPEVPWGLLCGGQCGHIATSVIPSKEERAGSLYTSSQEPCEGCFWIVNSSALLAFAAKVTPMARRKKSHMVGGGAPTCLLHHPIRSVLPDRVLEPNQPTSHWPLLFLLCAFGLTFLGAQRDISEEILNIRMSQIVIERQNTQTDNGQTIYKIEL